MGATAQEEDLCRQYLEQIGILPESVIGWHWLAVWGPLLKIIVLPCLTNVWPVPSSDVNQTEILWGCICVQAPLKKHTIGIVFVSTSGKFRYCTPLWWKHKKMVWHFMLNLLHAVMQEKPSAWHRWTSHAGFVALSIESAHELQQIFIKNRLIIHGE